MHKYSSSNQHYSELFSHFQRWCRNNQKFSERVSLNSERYSQHSESFILNSEKFILIQRWLNHSESLNQYELQPHLLAPAPLTIVLIYQLYLYQQNRYKKLSLCKEPPKVFQLNPCFISLSNATVCAISIFKWVGYNGHWLQRWISRATHEQGDSNEHPPHENIMSESCLNHLLNLLELFLKICWKNLWISLQWW